MLLLLARAPGAEVRSPWCGAVRQVQLSRGGAVQALLSNRTAWLYHTGLACWLCLADSAFAASPFTSLLPLNPALQGDAHSNMLEPRASHDWTVQPDLPHLTHQISALVIAAHCVVVLESTHYW